jgi:hypothetical protein
MKKIRKITFKGAIKQYFINFLLSEASSSSLPAPLRTGSLVLPYRLKS